jgi:hypothetical protein
MIALVLLLRYSLLLLGFGRSPFCKRKRDEREREQRRGEFFFLGAIMTSLLFLFSFSFSFCVGVGVCLEQGERPEKRRVAVAAAKKMVGGENFMRNLNESSYVLC